jgi:hypothetical protein
LNFYTWVYQRSIWSSRLFSINIFLFVYHTFRRCNEFVFVLSSWKNFLKQGNCNAEYTRRIYSSLLENFFPILEYLFQYWNMMMPQLEITCSDHVQHMNESKLGNKSLVQVPTYCILPSFINTYSSFLAADMRLL